MKKKWWVWGILILFFFIPGKEIKCNKEKSKKILLGIGVVDGEKYNVEFRKYNRLIPLYKKNNIEPVLFNSSIFYRRYISENAIYNSISRFHVIHLTTTPEGAGVSFDERKKNYAKIVGKALKKFVEEGGGLFIQIRPVRYPNGKDEEYWNEVFKVFGIKILHEGVFDKTREYEGKTLRKVLFFYTQNIKSHPVTNSVRCLYLPLHDYYPGPGITALKYSDEWKIIVRGEKEAKSYRSGLGGNPNVLNLDNPGTYSSEPPVVGVREFGKGRIVVFPISPLFTGLNYLNPLWENTVEEKGDPLSGRPSDVMRLLMNAYKWLGENALKEEKFGTYELKPYRRVSFPKKVNWDKKNFHQPAEKWGVKGIVGIHTSYTDGKGTVFEYVEEAKKNGISFVVFTEPLELLTPEEFEQLKNDCKKVNEKEDFYACPGIEFTDGAGIRWIMVGERLKYPPDKFKSGKYTYIQWDGKKVNHYGQYSMHCGFPQSGVIDYNQLKKVGGYPENQHWFFLYIPLAYNTDKLIADNYNQWLSALRDLRWTSIISFTRIRKPSDVKLANKTCVTIFKDLNSVKESLNRRGAPYWIAKIGHQQVSQGPVITQWESINDQMENNWKYTRGAQRVKLKFEVRSDAGIREVIIHDANYGVIRRFIAKGERKFSKEFELVHDKQHYLTLEVVDNKNKRAFSHYILIYSYKQGLFRCGDNLNILGPLGFWWHPDRNQSLPLGKSFRNGGKFALRGWDTADPALGVPKPSDMPCETIRIKGVGWYPDISRLNKFVGKIMNVNLASYNIQIVSMKMDHLVPMHDRKERPTPSYASLPLNQGELEYFERVHKMIAPADRVDFYIQWNYRRYRESIENYEGSFVWHEGYIKIKKDITLEGEVPIPLLRLQTPFDPERGFGDMLVVTEPEKTRVVRLDKIHRKERVKGRIRKGGYISWMPTILGYTAVFIPKEGGKEEWRYEGTMPGWIWVGIGKNGEKIKKGTVLKYKFLYGIFAEKKQVL